MPGVYGGLIIILAYAASEVVLEEFWLITQNGEDILTNTGQRILVQEDE